MLESAFVEDSRDLKWKKNGLGCAHLSTHHKRSIRRGWASMGPCQHSGATWQLLLIFPPSSTIDVHNTLYAPTLCTLICEKEVRRWSRSVTMLRPNQESAREGSKDSCVAFLTSIMVWYWNKNDVQPELVIRLIRKFQKIYRSMGFTV